MKILHLIIGLGNGGAENTLLKLCLIKNKKYTHEVISLTKNKEILSNFRKKKIKVHFLNFKKTRLNFFQILKLFKILKKKNPSFIFCWMYHACFVSIFIKYLLCFLDTFYLK